MNNDIHDENECPRTMACLKECESDNTIHGTLALRNLMILCKQLERENLLLRLTADNCYSAMSAMDEKKFSQYTTRVLMKLAYSQYKDAVMVIGEKGQLYPL